MKKRAVSAIAFSYVVITILVYALAAAILLESNNTNGEENNINNAVNINTPPNPELVDISCKSPCPPSSEMCIQMCA